MTNLAEQPEQAGRVRGMSAALLAEMKRNDDNLSALTVAAPKPAAFDPSAPAPNSKAGKKKR